MERFAMRPKERRDSGQSDFFKARLDQIVDMGHPLARLAATIDWRFLEERFGAVYSDKPGQPPLPTRLMAGLSILKHTHNLSDEELCARWVENPYYQLFCGEEFFRHKPPFDRSSLTRWRQRMGEEKLVALIQESLSAATRTGAAKPSDFTKAIVDTTVQPKAVAFPTDAKLMHRARELLVRLARKHGVQLRQSYARVGKRALIAYQRYAHAKQFKRANRALRSVRTYLGRVFRDIVRKTRGDEVLRKIFAEPLSLGGFRREVQPRRQHWFLNEKVGFPRPHPRLLLGFQGTKSARREGISSPFNDAGGCTSPQNSGGCCYNPHSAVRNLQQCGGLALAYGACWPPRHRLSSVRGSSIPVLQCLARTRTPAGD